MYIHDQKFIEITNQQILEFAPSAGAQAPISTASDRYCFIPTIKVVDMLRDEGWVPIEAQEQSVRKAEREGLQRHMIRFARQGMDITAGERVDLLLFNSHDLGTAFSLVSGIWRFVCENGLMIGSEMFNFTHKHMGFDPDEFLTSARFIAESTSLIADGVNVMKAIEMTPDDRGIYAEAAHTLVYGQPSDEDYHAPILPQSLLNERRFDDKGKDLWTTFNVVQENIIKGGLKGKSRTNKQRRTRPVKSIQKDAKLNKALWMITEKMREEKLLKAS